MSLGSSSASHSWFNKFDMVFDIKCKVMVVGATEDDVGHLSSV